MANEYFIPGILEPTAERGLYLKNMLKNPPEKY